MNLRGRWEGNQPLQVAREGAALEPPLRPAEAREISSDVPPDVADVCNYVAALEFARRQIADPRGLPIGTRLLCESHRILMRGIRGGERDPGELRRTQNWLKRRQQAYYERLTAVRWNGDWEGWTGFFLECVSDAAEDGVRVAQALRSLLARDRERVVTHERSTVAAIRLLDLLPSCPVVTVPKASAALGLTAPPARKAVELLETVGILRETTGKQRDRAYAYREYLQTLGGGEA